MFVFKGVVLYPCPLALETGSQPNLGQSDSPPGIFCQIEQRNHFSTEVIKPA